MKIYVYQKTEIGDDFHLQIKFNKDVKNGSIVEDQNGKVYKVLKCDPGQLFVGMDMMLKVSLIKKESV